MPVAGMAICQRHDAEACRPIVNRFEQRPF